MIKIEDDFFIDSTGTVLKSGKPVPVLKDKDGYKYVYIHIDGKRWQRYLAKLVATYLVENPMNYKYLFFIDGNKANCNPENIAWISNKQDAVKRKVSEKWRGKKVEFSKEYAIEKATCPILKQYYSTGDMCVINNYVEEIFKSVRKEVQVAMGWVYLYIYDRLERNSLFGDIKGYFIRMYRYFTKSEFSNVTLLHCH